MTKLPKTFVEACLAGEALVEDIYTFIDCWHETDTKLTLPGFLGMTDQDYAIWLEKPESLVFIIFSKKNNIPLSKALTMADGVAMAARAPSQRNAEEVLSWLRRTNRMK